MFELRQRDGTRSHTLAQDEDLEEVARIASEMAGLEVDEPLRLPGENDGE